MMDVEAFILIGGRSSRFGADKAFVKFDGETLVSRAARVLQDGLQPKSTSVILAAADQYPSDVLDSLPLTTLSDLKPGFGPWSGLHTALVSAASDWAFVLACDLPFVSSELLQVIVLGVTDDIDAVVPQQDDARLQPLCALYRVRSCTDVVSHLLLAMSDDVPRLAFLFDRVKTRIIVPDEYSHLRNANRFFVNINTPDDLASAALE